MDTQTMWVDATRCTGCGACVEVCPTEAIALVEGKARVDEEICIGCGACADECPEDAIQPVVQGELVPVEARLPRPYRPGPLARTIGRWLTRRPAPTRPPASGASRADGEAGRGRRARQRRRGQ